MIDYGKFEKSLKHLELQLQNFGNAEKRPELSAIDREAIAELPNSPKPLFRIAFENQLFPSIEQWLKHCEARIDTSHDYSEEKALLTIQNSIHFFHDATALYQKMTGKKWI